MGLPVAVVGCFVMLIGAMFSVCLDRRMWLNQLAIGGESVLDR